MNSTVQSWSELEGKVLNGQYPLGRCLSQDEYASVFSTEISGDEQKPAFIKVTALTENGQPQRDVVRLQRVQSLSHPNLIQLFGFGLGELEGLSVSYAVLEASDDNLASVLADRPLEHNELMELLNALVDPLDYLHGEGLVHTGLIPPNIFAVGETIKIACDCIQEPRSPRARAPKSPYTPPEFDTAGWTPAGDIWMLGVTMFYSLTQRYPVSASTIQNANLPLKIAALLSRCLQLDPEQRPTSAQIVAWSKKGEPFPTPRALTTPVQPVREVPVASAPAPVIRNGSAPVEAPAPPAAAQVSAASAGASSATQTVSPPATRVSPAPTLPPPDFILDDDNPDVVEVPSLRIRDELPRIDRLSALERYEGEPKRPAWIYAVVAVLVIVGIIWVLRASHRSSAPAGPIPASTAAAKPDSASAKSSEPLHANAKAANKTAPAAAPKAPQGTKLDRASVWRVVVFTYNKQSDAEQKVHALNAKHSGFKAEVFAPNKTRPPYLVALGGWMNHDGAARTRRAATSKGMPHDAYVQNFQR